MELKLSAFSNIYLTTYCVGDTARCLREVSLTTGIRYCSILSFYFWFVELHVLAVRKDTSCAFMIVENYMAPQMIDVQMYLTKSENNWVKMTVKCRVRQAGTGHSPHEMTHYLSATYSSCRYALRCSKQTPSSWSESLARILNNDCNKRKKSTEAKSL